MKKCPYCAEEIQDAAIVCRYCGRDLPVSGQSAVEKEMHPVSTWNQAAEAEKSTVSVWKQGAKASKVITILYVIATFVTSSRLNTSAAVGELIGRLTIGLVATYYFWLLVCAGVIWLWRKAGALGFILFVGAIFVGIAVWNGWAGSSFSPSPTATFVPSRTPIPTPTKTQKPTKTVGDPNCTWWYKIQDSDLGEKFCVQGVVNSITGNNENGALTRIYFRDLPAIFYFVDDTHYYRDLAIGDCVAATGTISINQDGMLFMRINGDLQKCQ